MTTWTIHEVAAACAVTTGEISQWISRGHFRPSVTVRSVERRRFDWRDLACLAVMGTLRKHALPMMVISLLTDRLRDDLTGMATVSELSGRFLFTDCAESQSDQVAGLVTEAEIFAALKRNARTVIIVDVAAAYRDAETALPIAALKGGIEHCSRNVSSL